MLQHVGAHDDVKGLVGQRHVRDIRNDVNVRIAVPRDILTYGQPKQKSEVWRKKMGYNMIQWILLKGEAAKCHLEIEWSTHWLQILVLPIVTLGTFASRICNPSRNSYPLVI